jgi:hypothetical protein
MTSTETKEPGTGVARSRNLPPELQARIEERRLQSAMLNKIRGATWASQWDAGTVSAVAAWARENDVDPITEIDVLGGNLYLKARHYERKMSHLIAAGQIEYARKDWVHADKRLDEAAKQGQEWAQIEAARRLQARIEFNLSESADAACVYRIKHRMMDHEVTGAKEHVPGKRKDPVGDAMPMETIETRALRRAMLQLKEAMPDLRVPTTKDDDYIEVGEIVEANHEKLKALRSADDLEPETGDDAEAETVATEAAEGQLALGDDPPRRRVAQQEGR